MCQISKLQFFSKLQIQSFLNFKNIYVRKQHYMLDCFHHMLNPIHFTKLKYHLSLIRTSILVRKYEYKYSTTYLNFMQNQIILH